MKTKAYSKEGLASSAKLDPAEQARAESGEFLGNQVDELEQQIETLEAESEQIQATMKKGKSQAAKAERIAEIDRVIERHKWHQGKLELIRRSLENGGIDTESVTDLEESIRYYVTDNVNADFIEDDTMYDDLNLDDEEGVYGMPQEDKGSSQDNASLAEEVAPEPEPKPAPVTKAKQIATEAAATTARKTSAQVKSPLPALATLHTPANLSSSSTNGSSMKPAIIPTRPAEGLKYASAAAAAAASDKIGISPLPPPPGASPVPTAVSLAQAKTSATSSPAATSAQPVTTKEADVRPLAHEGSASSARATPTPAKSEKPRAAGKTSSTAAPEAAGSKGNFHAWPSKHFETDRDVAPQANGTKPSEEDEDSIYHLPESLQDLLEAYEIMRKKPTDPTSPTTQRMLQLSQSTAPDLADMDVPQRYRPDVKMPSSSLGFPTEPLPIFDNPQLYSKIDPDTLFYVFYYKQGSPQQYLAAKALKDQSWRFHKQYQTWFQRHEEPKNITEEFEQGTYRFFDYESTW